jgi:hypothetical protein
MPKYAAKQISRSQKEFIKNIFKAIKIFFFPALLIIGLVLLSQINYFKIQNVNFEGAKTIKEEDLHNFIETHLGEENRLLFFSQNNFFFLDTSELESKLGQKFPLNSVNVKKVFPNSLEVQLDEKISTIVFTNGEEYELLDLNGDYLKPLTIIINQNNDINPLASSSTQPNNNTTSTFKTLANKQGDLKIRTNNIGREYQSLPIIYTKNNKIFSNKGLGVISKQSISAAIELKNRVEKQKIGYVKYFTIDDLGTSLEATTNSSWKILFNPKNNYDNQINNLKLVTKENSPKEYVDVRYDGRVYYK